MAPQSVPETRFEACASTASLFLYAQGSTIICLHHDTLAVERRFTSHQEKIDFISVDNVSERGAGRLVVSYDVGQTAIVWDIFTGTEIARFASFEQLRVASWMRNGNVAFGMGFLHRLELGAFADGSGLQVMEKARSSSLSLLLRNIYPRALSSILSHLLHRLQIVVLMRSGKFQSPVDLMLLLQN